MDRKTVLAILLMLIVAVLPTILSPRKPPPPVAGSDSVGAVPETLAAQPPDTTPGVATPAPAVVSAPSEAPTSAQQVVVQSPLYRMTFSSRGARLTQVALNDYRSFAPGDSGRAQLMPPDSRFLIHELVYGRDTLSLAEWQFQPSDTVVTVEGAGTELTWVAARGPVRVTLTYRFEPDRYVFDVAGRVEGLEIGGVLLVHLGPRIRSVEADSAENFRNYAVVTKAQKTASVGFGKLDSGVTRALEGPFEWVAIKSKYFVVSTLVLDEGAARFGGVLVTGGPKLGKYAVNADLWATLPMPAGQFHYAVYAGPQEFRRLAGVGHDFQDINPYGWILRPVIQPFANLIVRILLWMHEVLTLPYGWVLILFGLAVRLVLWPLNQKAMRSSMAMQAIQPEIKALQDRLKSEPQRMQQELMKLYKEHNVNPFGGCLPMLIPMPVLFALFFVFRETIEFRGVPFLWLPDLSRADPYYIIPILMGLSMYAVTRLGQMGVPPNPQAKMMRYFMPGFMTLLFLRFSSGLNLYYAVSNIASIPQQWMIARERMQRIGANPSGGSAARGGRKEPSKRGG